MTVADFEVRDDGATTITQAVNSSIGLKIDGVWTSGYGIHIDNASGAIASDKAMIFLDAGGANASGSNMIRMAPTGSAAAGSIGLEFVGNGKVMQAMYIDSDPTANSVVEIRGGGVLTDGNAILEVGVDGSLATGGCGILIEQGTGSPNAGSRLLELEATSTDMIGVYADVDGATNDVYYFESGGAVASGKAVMHLVCSGDPADDTGAVLRVTNSGTTTAESRGISVHGGDITGLFIDTDSAYSAANDSGAITLYSNVAGDLPVFMNFYHEDAGAADGEYCSKIFFYGSDDAPAKELYASIEVEMDDTGAANPDGILWIKGDLAGTNTVSAGFTGNTVMLGAAAATLTSAGAWDLTISTALTAANEPKIVLTDGAAGDITVTAGGTSGSFVLASPMKRLNQVGVTADVGSTQGDGAFDKDYLEIATCANAGDAVTLPAAAAGRVIIVTNRGASSADVFPASGDNINEAGADTAIACAADASRIFIGIDGTHWESLILARA